ncbi:MAG: flagellin [Paenibacillaceae bacterium]|nr:flagellin [Paenibacillaceae bacterium]
MRINHNITALNTYRQLSSNNDNLSRSIEKLSSGLRINRAGDDAAGLAISEKMRGQIRGLDQGARNAQDAISMIQTAEGALNETHSILQRMRELAVQGSNDTLQTEDRKAIGEELKALASEIDRIANSTQFNGKTLLNGSIVTSLHGTNGAQVGDALGTTGPITVSKIDVSNAAANTMYTFSDVGNNLTLSASVNGVTVSQTLTVAGMNTAGEQTLNFNTLGVSLTITGGGDPNDTGADIADKIATNLQSVNTASGSSSAQFAIGANAGQNMLVSFGDMNTDQLGNASNINTLVNSVGANLVIDTLAKAQTLITEIDAAIVDVSTQRGVFGAAQNRLEHTINNLQASAENLTSSESRIRDVDMAKELMSQTKNNILAQAAQAMLAQANQTPQGVLQLLR